ncbi:hypothetical protein HII36_51765 [Nonomuraea sp. NN258]|uniref:hypothetical protein n=1 Tax=Nonomuraea antri TaxID=2730852 RepID=UPI00156A2BAA|nr:hypothetical protein [Nonomuraea antri]NRQ40247.1 hypothetical protein [Nonomuraea antri]
MHVGPLEPRLVRAWDPTAFPPPQTLLSIMTVSAVPHPLAMRLAAHLSGGILIGAGSVPDLAGFEHLRDVPLPLQPGSWTRSAGVYDPALRRIGVGSVGSPSVSVVGHELGHAVDHMDGGQSRTSAWHELHLAVRDDLAPPYRNDVAELFAEAFAAVLTRHMRRLIHLFTDEQPALQAYRWLNRRYGIG